MDIQKYRPVIDGVLRKLKVSPGQRDDMMQECYMVLLEREGSVETAEYPLGFAETTCRNRILDIWRKEGRQVPIESLDDFKTAKKTSRIPAPLPKVDEELMREAMKTLTEDELDVITRLYVEGYSRMETATTLGIHTSTVDRRGKSGVEKLKKYFGESR